MNFSLVIHKPRWRTIFTIPRGTVLQKGRHGIYHDIAKAASQVSEKFGCYSWKSDSAILYCGSFARDYRRGSFKTNLQARVHNYWQNHKEKPSGQKNTNLMVFENIIATLEKSVVALCLFEFDSLQIGDSVRDFAAFSQDPDLVHAVEQLLICTYRQQEQSQWNRT